MRESPGWLSSFLVPAGATSGLLALLILFFTVQSSTGSQGQSAAMNNNFQVQSQAINQRFQNGSIGLTRLNPANTQAVSRARSALMNRYQVEANANNLRWQASIKQANRSALKAQWLLTTACLLSALSIAAFALRLYDVHRSRRQAASA